MGWEALEAALGTAYPSQLALHRYVVLEMLGGDSSSGSSSSGSGGSASSGDGHVVCVAYDFLPANPLSPITAAVLLSGGSVEGAVGPVVCTGQLESQPLFQLS